MTSRLGLVAALSALLVTSLGAAPAATAVDPAYGAPAVGQCFDMDHEEMMGASYSDPAVDCAGAHTSQVIAVTTLPDGMSFKPTDRLVKVVMKACLPAGREALGASLLELEMTAYGFAFFVPTAEQRAAGARWLRCDLVLLKGQRLAPLPNALAVGAFPFADSVSRCMSGRDFDLTVCSARHTYRAVAAVKVKGKRYPSDRRWKRLATAICPRVVTSNRYRYTNPGKGTWQAGNHTIVCYTRTRR